jgi:hypothetical protein
MRSTRLFSAQPFPENPTGIYGDIAPTGFFDPAGLSKNADAVRSVINLLLTRTYASLHVRLH